MTEIRKIYITSDLKTVLTCPGCQTSKRTDISRFMGHEKEVKLRCRCSSCRRQFSVILERRRSVRKRVSFPGWLLYKSHKYKISIKDISKHGLQIFLHENLSIAAGTRINVEFTMDDPMKSSVQRDVRVKNIFSPTKIGCEFLSADPTGNLAKYFMFYY